MQKIAGINARFEILWQHVFYICSLEKKTANNTMHEGCKIIHQIWWQGKDAVPDKYKSNMAQVRDRNVGWKHMVWDDSSIRNLLQTRPHWLKAYENCVHMHQQIDFGRYCILFFFGGISIDADVSVVNPLDMLWETQHIPDDKVVVSKAPLNAMEASIVSLRPVRFWLNNATIICPQKKLPGQLRLCESMAHVLLHPPKLLYIFGSPMWQINWTTGPTSFSGIFLDDIPKEEYHVLRSDMFEPCVGYDNACQLDKNVALLDHHHDGTWHGSSRLIQLYYWTKHSLLDIVILIVCITMLHRILK